MPRLWIPPPTTDRNTRENKWPRQEEENTRYATTAMDASVCSVEGPGRSNDGRKEAGSATGSSGRIGGSRREWDLGAHVKSKN